LKKDAAIENVLAFDIAKFVISILNCMAKGAGGEGVLPAIESRGTPADSTTAGLVPSIRN
jgi:hypothetical protein